MTDNINELVVIFRESYEQLKDKSVNEIARDSSLICPAVKLLYANQRIVQNGKSLYVLIPNADILDVDLTKGIAWARRALELAGLVNPWPIKPAFPPWEER